MNTERSRMGALAALGTGCLFAIAVDASATRSERNSAFQMSCRFQATPNHCRVRPGGGNW